MYILYSSQSDAVVVFLLPEKQATYSACHLHPFLRTQLGALGSCQKETPKKHCCFDIDYNQHMQTQAHAKLSNLSSHAGCQYLKQVMLYLSGTATLSQTLLERNKRDCKHLSQDVVCLNTWQQVFPGSPVLLCDKSMMTTKHHHL